MRRIILSSTPDKTYVEFIPHVAKIWKAWGYVVDIGLVGEFSEDQIDALEEIGNVSMFTDLPGINQGILAKISRSILAQYYQDDIVMLGDIDMIPLDRKYFEGLFEMAQKAPHKMVLASADYRERINPPTLTKPILNKVPICYMVARSSVWQEIVNPANLTIESLIYSWRGTNVYDKMEAVDQEFPKFSDESLLRRLLSVWNPEQDRITKLSRGWSNNRAHNRIDRAQWKYDRDKLNTYIDCHSLRPLKKHWSFVEPLIKHALNQ